MKYPFSSAEFKKFFNDTAIRDVLKNSSWLVVARSGELAFTLAQSILIARMLTVPQYGILGLVITFVTTLNRLTSFRMNEFVIRYLSSAVSAQRIDKSAAVIKIALGVESIASLLAFVITILLAPLGAKWFIKVEDGPRLIVVYALVILGNLVSETTIGVLQSFGQFRLQSLTSLLTRAISLLCIIVVMLLGASLYRILLVNIVSNLISSLLLTAIMVHTINARLGSEWWKTSVSVFKDQWGEMRRFVINTNISATMSIITKDSDLLWLGLFRSPTEVGYYKLATSLVALIFLPVSAMAEAIFPNISQITSVYDWSTLRTLLRKATIISSSYVIPVVLVSGLLSPALIGVLYGSNYVPASPAVRILLVGLAFANIFYWTRPVLLALGQPGFLVRVNFGLAIVKLAGVFLILPIWGYLGNAALISLLYILGIGMSLYRVWTEVPKHTAASALNNN